MLQWLLQWFRKDPDAMYRPSERLLFPFWNGKKTIYADPQILYKRVMANGPELSVELKGARAPIKGAAECHNRAMQLIREAFVIAPPPADNPLDCSETLSEPQLEELLNNFLLWADELKKNTKPMPTFATGTSATTAPSSVASPATASTSASGSTASESSTAAPTVPLSEPASPSAPSNPAWTTVAPTPTVKDQPS